MVIMNIFPSRIDSSKIGNHRKTKISKKYTHFSSGIIRIPDFIIIFAPKKDKLWKIR